MVLQDVRAANVKALTDGALLALHRDDFNALLGSLTHIRHMWRFEALRKVYARTLHIISFAETLGSSNRVRDDQQQCTAACISLISRSLF